MSEREEGCILSAEDNLDDLNRMKPVSNVLKVKEKVNAVTDSYPHAKESRECLKKNKAQSELKKIPIVITVPATLPHTKMVREIILFLNVTLTRN